MQFVMSFTRRLSVCLSVQLLATSWRNNHLDHGWIYMKTLYLCTGKNWLNSFASGCRSWHF